MPEQMETLDTLYALGAAGEIENEKRPEELRMLMRAAEDAFNAWRWAGRAVDIMREWERKVTPHAPVHRWAEAQRMAATAAYCNAYELWQAIEQLGAEMLSEPAYSHAEPGPMPSVCARCGKPWQPGVEIVETTGPMMGGKVYYCGPCYEDVFGAPTQETSPASQLDTSDMGTLDEDHFYRCWRCKNESVAHGVFVARTLFGERPPCPYCGKSDQVQLNEPPTY